MTSRGVIEVGPMANIVKRSKAELKTDVERIVLAQGNVFIRELLRDHDLPIGITKKDFRAHLDDAIDDEKFTQDMLEEWLLKVEGWGDQHIYMYVPPAVAPTKVRVLLEKSEFKKLIDRPVSYDFPADLTLSSMTVHSDALSIVWHQSSTGWKRDEAKDRHEMIDDDLYEFRAYRQRYDRAVVRFEWRFADPYCCILLQLPYEGTVHAAALGVVWGDLQKIGLAAGPFSKIALSKAIKQLSRNKDVETRKSKRMTAGGYVELGSTTPDTSIADIEAVREVLRDVDDKKFKDADGVFSLDNAKFAALSKAVKLQGHGEDSRLRVWVQCKRDDIFFLLKFVHDQLAGA